MGDPGSEPRPRRHPEDTSGERSDPGKTGRLLGRYTGSPEGPLLVCVGGMHGNEPSGVEAIRRVLRKLSDLRPPFRGELVGLVGNVRALRRRRRFVSSDLNRLWSPQRVAALRASAQPSRNGGDPEDDEQRELLAALERLLTESREARLLDLHTTSSDGPPFLTVNETAADLEFAHGFSLPRVVGLHQAVRGTLSDYLSRLGYVALGVEGGSHTSPASVEHLEAAIWSGLTVAGHLEVGDVPDPDRFRRLLSGAAGEIPELMRVFHRHEVHQGGGFRMRPGYRNFQPVTAGEVIARNDLGEIRSPASGRIFLPLYQKQGSDGFFLVRDVEQEPVGDSPSSGTSSENLRPAASSAPGDSPRTSRSSPG